MQLSSSITPFVRYWGLACSLVMFPVGLSMIARNPNLLTLLWTVSLPFIMWWLWSFKEARIDGDRFIIGNHRRAIAIPFLHLKDFSESRSNRSSHITLVFDPPTTYGRKIRFWPPLSDRFNGEPDRISNLLRDIIKNAKSPAEFQDDQNIDQSRRGQKLVGVPVNWATAGCNSFPFGYEGSCYNQVDGVYVNGILLRSSQTYTTASKNNWNHVEAYYRPNPISNENGQDDGVIRVWFNNALVFERTNAILKAGQNLSMKFNQFIVTIHPQTPT